MADTGIDMNLHFLQNMLAYVDHNSEYCSPKNGVYRKIPDHNGKHSSVAQPVRASDC